MNAEATRHRDVLDSTACRLRNEEAQKMNAEERLEKVVHDLQEAKSEQMTVSPPTPSPCQIA